MNVYETKVRDVMEYIEPINAYTFFDKLVNRTLDVEQPVYVVESNESMILVTRKDLLKVIFDKMTFQELMSKPSLTIEANKSVIVASLKMIEYDTRYLLVTENKKYVGILRMKHIGKYMTSAMIKDPLTGAYNRALLTIYPELVSDNRSMIAMIDLNNFKQINDTQGHDVGDSILQKLVYMLNTQLKQKLSKQFYIIRYGGDEFLILFNEDDEISVIEVLEHVRSSISFSYAITEYTPSVSINLIIRKLDRGLYQQKQLKCS